MAAIRFAILKSLSSSAKPSSRVQLCQPCGYYDDIVKYRDKCDVRPTVTSINHSYHAKEASTELTPYVEQLLDAHPYLRHVILPVGCTLAATIVAWAMIPRLLRRFHMYSTQHPAALLSGINIWRPAPYEKSCWGALEDPVRYLIAFVAFSHM